MDSLSTGPLAQLLDRSHVEKIMAEVARVEAAGGSIADLASGDVSLTLPAADRGNEFSVRTL